MKNRFYFLAVSLLFWMIFCIDARILFLLYNHSAASTLPLKELLLPFLYGARMDLSLCGYLMFLPTLLFIWPSPRPALLSAFFSGYTLLLFSLNALVVIIDMELYRHWGFRIEGSVLEYLQTPKEALASTDLLPGLLLLLLYIVWVVLAYILYQRAVIPLLKRIEPLKWQVSLPLFLLATAFWILPVRGSFTVAPMNPAFVYFSADYPFANHAAINAPWNFWQTAATRKMPRPITFFPSGEAEERSAELLPPASGSIDTLLRVPKPNIVLILAESLTAKVIEPLGGMAGVTPRFSELCTEGILFTHIFSTGDRTAKGVLSVLSGTPGHPQVQMINFNSRARKLPHLATDLVRLGYRSRFIYGGDADFVSMRTYLTEGGFQEIYDVENFPRNLNVGKWGVHDEHVLNRLLELNTTSDQPFFHVCLTQSNHEPFQVPMTARFVGEDEGSRFKNSAWYADSVLYHFIEKAKSQSWYANTLFVIVADHGTRHPDNQKLEHPLRFHVPMLWLGGALNPDLRGSRIARYGSQNDIAPTLLSQLGEPNNNYLFSKNLLQQGGASFATFAYKGGFGIMADSTRIIFDMTLDKPVFEEGRPDPELLNRAKGYMQGVMEYFEALNRQP